MSKLSWWEVATGTLEFFAFGLVAAASFYSRSRRLFVAIFAVAFLLSPIVSMLAELKPMEEGEIRTSRDKTSWRIVRHAVAYAALVLLLVMVPGHDG